MRRPHAACSRFNVGRPETGGFPMRSHISIKKKSLAQSQLLLLLESTNMKRVTDIFGDVWEKLLVTVLEILRLFIPKLRHIIQKPAVYESKEDLTHNIVPISVNYHLTRQCNYKCGFCFHTATTSFVLPLEEARKGLRMLKEEGMQKINFSGGEPFLPDRGCFLGELVRFCKEELSLPSVTIVSNGSTISEAWFKKYGSYLDILAISCDSFNEETNCNIGRGRGTHIRKLMKIRDWCNRYNVAFKINTVVNTENIEEDMSDNILALRPVRWKVFQCLLLKGENVGENALRNAEKFYVTDHQFQKFLERHKNVPVLVPESNQKMQNSYLILDEYMRFLDCRRGDKKPSPSILDIGVKDALNFSGFDEKMFKKRGGVYKWSKANMDLDW